MQDANEIHDYGISWDVVVNKKVIGVAGLYLEDSRRFSAQLKGRSFLMHLDGTLIAGQPCGGRKIPF